MKVPMISTFYIKSKNLFYYLFFLVIDFILQRKKIRIYPGTLLITRLDSIGDYILFRNFLKEIKGKEKYHNYSITLCGNILWKELAETFDKDVVNNFIWIDRKKFYTNPFYKYKMLKQIRETGFEVVIDPTYTREILFADTIIKSSGAKERIGSSGALDKHTMWRRKLLTNRYFTKLIPMNKNNLFEFYRNKEFFEKLLGTKINIQAPHLEVSPIEENINQTKPYAVIFPGAASEERKWDVKNFAIVSDFIVSNYFFDIVIAGSSNEKILANNIIFLMKNKDCVFDYTSKTNLMELTKLIGGSKILISNDTGAVHIAAAVNTSFICISNGNHFGRFHPYPKEIFEEAYFIYPNEIMNRINDIKGLSKQYRFSSDLNINEIKPQTVKEIIKKVLG